MLAGVGLAYARNARAVAQSLRFINERCPAFHVPLQSADDQVLKNDKVLFSSAYDSLTEASEEWLTSGISSAQEPTDSLSL